MTKWFRFYADAMRNPKVAALSDREFRLWVALLSAASENEGRIPPAEELKHVLKTRLDHLLTGVERLIRAGLIDRLAVGYEPHNWSKFQYKSDTSTERVRKHREERNVSETPPDTETEQKQKIQPLAQQPTSPPARREDLLDRLLKAAGVKGNGPTGLAFPGEIIGLMQAGYDLEADILPAISAKPNPNVRSWAYYVPIVREAAERRSSAASVRKPEAAAVDWAGRLRVWREGRTWNLSWGPNPDDKRCQAPPELLREQAA